MDAPGDNRAPVVIKRKKNVIADGHHGGAWKVAYADFVTAMMAFFLLMWLLNATTEKQRKGIADYFSPTIAVNRVSGGGDGAFGGDSVFTEQTLARNGTGATNKHPTESDAARGEVPSEQPEMKSTGTKSSEIEDQAIKKLEEALSGKSGESTISHELKRHVRTQVTDEGLVIELFDLESARLFAENEVTPTLLLEELAEIVTSVSMLVNNSIAVEAHTHARPVVLADSPVWDLSTDRANQMRLLLQRKGLEHDRIERITGHADKQPVVRNAFAIRNNRLEVILLRSDVARKMGGRVRN